MDGWNRAVLPAYYPGDDARRKLCDLLKDERWQVRCAAALSLGRRRERASVPALIEALREDMVQENYPPMAQNGDASDLQGRPVDFADPVAQNHFVKRWRFVMCCAIALGQIGDPAAAPVLCEILDRKVDFYPALANAALALGRIGDSSALPSLENYRDYYEVNTRARAREAITRITSHEITTRDARS